MSSTLRWVISEVWWIKPLLRGRWLQWAATMVTLAVFVLVILTGLFGTPAGNHNFGIVYVWLVWWALLKLGLVPFLGRFWCGICPIPAPGEWLQRRAIVQPRPGGKLFTLRRRWPKVLRNMWAQNLGFVAIALFSALILTSPFVTALVLLGFIVLSVVTSILFERRTFCRYLCPIGGFIGVYSQVAPVEVRIKDQTVCLSCKEKTCYKGSDRGYGCPWFNLPQKVQANTFCGMCGECLRTCANDNIAFNIRKPGQDLLRTTGRRVDEAFNGLLMLTGAFVYSVVLIGPEGWLKATARAVGTPGWFVFAAVLLALNLAVVPGLFWASVRAGEWISSKLGNRETGPLAEKAHTSSGRSNNRPVYQFTKLPTTTLFADYGTVLVPLGLAVWMAFTLSFTMVNLSYAWPALSDPFGWGWNLLGTAGMAWTPYVSGLIPYLQVPMLVVGLAAAVALALRTARQHGQSPWAAVPVSVFCSAAVIGLITLYMA